MSEESDTFIFEVVLSYCESSVRRAGIERYTEAKKKFSLLLFIAITLLFIFLHSKYIPYKIIDPNFLRFLDFARILVPIFAQS